MYTPLIYFMEEKINGFQSLVDYQTYMSDKDSFFKAHGYAFKVYTSSLDQYNRYHKEYCFEDGACWYEICGPVTVAEDVEIKLAKVRVEVKMFRTEYYSSDCSRRKYYHEAYNTKKEAEVF